MTDDFSHTNATWAELAPKGEVAEEYRVEGKRDARKLGPIGQMLDDLDDGLCDWLVDVLDVVRRYLIKLQVKVEAWHA